MAYEVKDGTGILKELAITNNAGDRTEDLSKIYSELDYFEDITAPAPTLNIVLKDGVDLKGALPIVGGEILRFSFSDTYESKRGFPVNISNGGPYYRWVSKLDGGFDPETGEPDDTIKRGEQPEQRRPMRVYKLQGRHKEQDRLDGYAISCITGDFQNSLYEKVQKSYKGTCHEIVQALLGEYFGVGFSPGMYNKTDGQVKFVFTRDTPIGAIRKIAAQAESKGDNDSNYFFYQTNLGYNFRNLESLIGAEPRRKYMFITGNVGCDESYEGNRILNLSEPVSTSTLDGVVDGQYGVNVRFYDPIAKAMYQKSYSHYDSKYPKDWRSKDRNRNHPLIPEVTSKELSKNSSIEKFVVTNYVSHKNKYVTDRDSTIRNQPIRRQNFLAKSTAIHSAFLRGSLQIMVYGDSSLCAGDVVSIEVPATGEGKITESFIDKLTSGNYLIVSVRHNLTPENYYTILTITKNTHLVYPGETADHQADAALEGVF
jgi:hypothetical protein